MAITTIYCFRNDLRLSDNPAFLKACSDSDFLLPLFCHPKEELFKSNIPRIGIHRQFFLRQALDELKTVLNTYNSDLIEVYGDFAEEIKKMAETIHATKIIFEKIEANFKNNLQVVKADLTFKVYPGATHAFSNPEATANGKKFNIPITYNEKADKESWDEMKKFLARIFG